MGHPHHGEKKLKKPALPVPIESDSRPARKWKKSTITKRNIQRIRKREYMFLRKNFSTLCRELILDCNGGDALKIKSGVLSALQRIVETRLIHYIKTAGKICALSGNNTLLASHLKVVDTVLNMSGNSTFGRRDNVNNFQTTSSSEEE